MKDQVDVPDRALRVFRQFAHHAAKSNEGDRPPHKQIAQELHVGVQAISNGLKILRDKGLMKGFKITPAGWSFYYNQGRVAPSSVAIPIAGTVQAGRTAADASSVYIRDVQELEGNNLDHVTVPAVNEPNRTVALLVRGTSMEDEYIFDGDYVLVELLEGDKSAKDGELVVARYVPLESVVHRADDNIEIPSADEETELEGPTLKFYYPRPDQRCYWLSPRKNTHSASNVIHAASVRVIGRVVGLYREF